MTQVADTTGLPLKRVSFSSGDSTFPAAPYSGASQTTATVGSAVFAAASEWKRRLFARCEPDSPFTGAASTALQIVDDAVVARKGGCVSELHGVQRCGRPGRERDPVVRCAFLRSRGR